MICPSVASLTLWWHNQDMPKRSSKPDPNEIAKRIIDQVSGEKPTEPAQPDQPAKNPAAVELGRLGGLKGGKARAAKLSAEKRSEIAKKAAAKRWGNR